MLNDLSRCQKRQKPEVEQKELNNKRQTTET